MTRKPWHSQTELPSEAERLAQVERAIAAIRAATPADYAGMGVRNVVRAFALQYGVVADEGALYPAAAELLASTR